MVYMTEEDQNLLKDLAWKMRFGFGSKESFMAFWEDRMQVYYLDKPKPSVCFVGGNLVTTLELSFQLTESNEFSDSNDSNLLEDVMIPALTWKERVIQEKKELDEKIDKLKGFLEGNNLKDADETEFLRLEVQLSVMESYSNILRSRINSWTIDATEA
jgi:hypothetical protein